jgi:hypothetical protein
MPAHRFAQMLVSPDIFAERKTLARSTTPPVATRPVWRRATVARVSGLDGWLRARSPFYGLPCDAPRSSTPMRTDRLLLPTAFDYEHPRLIGSRHLFETFASPLGHAFARRPMRPGDPAFHDARSALAGRPGWHVEFSSACSRTSRASDTPVASPFGGDALSRERASWGRLDHAADPPVKVRSATQSEVPSIDG